MLKNSILASAMALILVASLASTSEAATKSKKTPKKNQQTDPNGLNSPEQGQYDRGGNSDSGSNNGYNSDNNGSSSSGGDSVSMFKAGNTSLPSGTYAMTNVSTGAAFVVIVDDSGDMRAQDARAMNLIDDSKSAKGGSPDNSKRNNGGSSYNDSNYDDSQYSASRYGNSDYGGSQSGNSNNYHGGSPAQLAPEPTPASAVLPTPMKGHPLLQGATQGSIYSQAGGSVPNLYTQQNPLMQGQSPTGQFPGGMKGAIQAELQRQLGKQLMKHGPQIEQEVRKVIQKFN